MITVGCKGWLGNILFEYAAARSLAIKHGTEVCLDLGRYQTKRDPRAQWMVRQLRPFNLSARLHRPVCRKIAKRFGVHLPPRGTPYAENGWGYDPVVQTLDDGAYLSGYFQSEHYFKSIESVIRNDMKVNAFDNDREVAALANRMSSANSIGVHVRRGDYVAQPFFNVCTINYFQRAVEYMRGTVSSPHFFVFSDDLAWCREHLRLENCTYVDVAAARKNCVADMYLMGLCKHNVISNSTFSWWGAWLNRNPDKVVVAPNRWFGDESMNRHAMRDTVVSDWIQIEV